MRQLGQFGRKREGWPFLKFLFAFFSSKGEIFLRDFIGHGGLSFSAGPFQTKLPRPPFGRWLWHSVVVVDLSSRIRSERDHAEAQKIELD